MEQLNVYYNSDLAGTLTFGPYHKSGQIECLKYNGGKTYVWRTIDEFRKTTKKV